MNMKKVLIIPVSFIQGVVLAIGGIKVDCWEWWVIMACQFTLIYLFDRGE